MTKPSVLTLGDLPIRTGSSYPPEFAKQVQGRSGQALGNPFDLTQFGADFELNAIPQATAVCALGRKVGGLGASPIHALVNKMRKTAFFTSLAGIVQPQLEARFRQMVGPK